MELYPYQQKAVDFIRRNKKVYLALDMGMGKTITSLAASELVAEKNVILIAEKNEIVNSRNFEREVGHFDIFKYINLRETELPKKAKKSTIEGVRNVPMYTKRLVCGINPESLPKQDNKVIKECFDSMIIDEATLAKNTKTKKFKTVKKVAEELDYLSLLSGTPMLNGAAELYAPLVLLEHPMVQEKGSQKAFESVFAGGHYRKIRNTGKWFQDYIWWAKGAQNVRVLRYLLRDHFFFMSKGETGAFKTKRRATKEVQMSLEWLGEYTYAWEEYLKKAKKRKVNMDNVSELRNLIENGQCYQVNSRWKAKEAVKDIAEGKYGDKRIVIWSMYIETDNLIQEELEKRGVSYKTFDELPAWKKGNEQVLVGRIKSHNKGGNVPEASVAIFIDMDFVPSNNIQAENRIDRPEQKEDMLIVYYITKGDEVVDTHVRNINRDKARRIEKFMKPLTEAELSSMPEQIEVLKKKFRKETEILGL